jgi:hypothetical protein
MRRSWCPLRNLDEVRLRLQWLTDDGARVRVALQSAPEGAWSQEEVSGRAVARYVDRVGMEDLRDWSELQQQARAARREWGHEGGFAEWTSIQGKKVRRRPPAGVRRLALQLSSSKASVPVAEGRLLRAFRTTVDERNDSSCALAGIRSGYDFPYWFKGLAALGRRQLRVSSLRCGPLRRRHQTCVGWLVGRAITPVHDSDDAEQSVGGGGGPTWRVGSSSGRPQDSGRVTNRGTHAVESTHVNHNHRPLITTPTRRFAPSRAN